MMIIERAVIGAGPAGAYYASLADGAHIFEEHKTIGHPVACTGILTSSINSLMKVPDEVILSKINSYIISSPNGKNIRVNLRKPDILLDRTGFDRMLFEKALSNGTIKHLGERFLGYKKVGDTYKIKTSKQYYTTKMIVGADGPNSLVGNTAGIINKRRLVVGLQARCKYNAIPGTVETFLGKNGFSWIVPENSKTARIGIISEPKSLKENFRKLIGKSKIIEYQSGLIPVYNPWQQLKKPKDNIFLIGDAATQVKATTYGGIIYGLHAAAYLANNPDTYEHRFNKDFRKELWLSLKIRQILNNLSENQADRLINIFAKKENMKILEEGSRDYPSKMIIKLIMREPKLIGISIGMIKRTFA
jgi:flavin-dependent dehydrogenase